MRLKEIKPGMAIICHNAEQADAAVEQLIKQGAVTGCNSTCYSDVNNILFYNFDNKFSFWDAYEATCDFSDLILPELTAEEVLEICHKICGEKTCNECPMSENCFARDNSDFKEVVEICGKWKSDHEKKEPEIETEWFWQGRIFKINEDGCYYQIKDGTGFYDTGCEYRESAEEYMADELKEYCKTHKGKFIAVVEHVCRVKR